MVGKNDIKVILHPFGMFGWLSHLSQGPMNDWCTVRVLVRKDFCFPRLILVGKNDTKFMPLSSRKLGLPSGQSHRFKMVRP